MYFSKISLTSRLGQRETPVIDVHVADMLQCVFHYFSMLLTQRKYIGLEKILDWAIRGPMKPNEFWAFLRSNEDVLRRKCTLAKFL